MSPAMSGGIPSARTFAHVRKNFLSPVAKPSIGSNVPQQPHPGPLRGKLPAPCSGGFSHPGFFFFFFFSFFFFTSFLLLKNSPHQEKTTSRPLRQPKIPAAIRP